MVALAGQGASGGAGIGDFDGDGRDDVLFRRRDNGARLYYAVQAPDVSPRAEIREGLRVTQNPAFRAAGHR